MVVTGRGARDAPRLEAAAAFGADLVVDIEIDDARRRLHEATGEQADVVIDVTAKAAAVPGQALHLVRPGGTVVLAGTRGAPDAPGFDPDVIVYKEIRVLGALGVDAKNYRSALDLLEEGIFPFAELPRQVAGFDDLEDLVRAMAGESDDEPPVHAVFQPEA